MKLIERTSGTLPRDRASSEHSQRYEDEAVVQQDSLVVSIRIAHESAKDILDNDARVLTTSRGTLVSMTRLQISSMKLSTTDFAKSRSGVDFAPSNTVILLR